MYLMYYHCIYTFTKSAVTRLISRKRKYVHYHSARQSVPRTAQFLTTKSGLSNFCQIHEMSKSLCLIYSMKRQSSSTSLLPQHIQLSTPHCTPAGLLPPNLNKSFPCAISSKGLIPVSSAPTANPLTPVGHRRGWLQYKSAGCSSQA